MHLLMPRAELQQQKLQHLLWQVAFVAAGQQDHVHIRVFGSNCRACWACGCVFWQGVCDDWQRAGQAKQIGVAKTCSFTVRWHFGLHSTAWILVYWLWKSRTISSAWWLQYRPFQIIHSQGYGSRCIWCCTVCVTAIEASDVHAQARTQCCFLRKTAWPALLFSGDQCWQTCNVHELTH